MFNNNFYIHYIFYYILKLITKSYAVSSESYKNIKTAYLAYKNIYLTTINLHTFYYIFFYIIKIFDFTKK